MLYCDQDYQLTKNDYNILIVEDSEFINKAIFSLLSQKKSYKLDQAHDFLHAESLLKNKDFNFILLDLNLPDAYGEELVSEIQKLTNAKIIVLTSEVDIQIRESLFKKGILDYIVKEKNFTSIINSINNSIEALEKNRSDTVLVVDDSMFMCKQLEKILKVRNYSVATALNAKEALKKLQTLNISTIVLDMELPDKHGLEFLQEMKDIDEFCHIPVLIVSSTNDPEVIRKALRTGASDFIKKPFIIEEFTLKVDLSVETNRRYVEAICSKKMLGEYKEAVDESSYVSKTDLNGNITYANELFCTLSGYTRDELIGSPHSIVRHPDVSASIFKGMWKTIQAKKTWHGIIKNKKKNGEAYYVKSTIKPILDVDGNILEYIAIRTDITEVETYKEILKENLNISNNNLQYLQQYENAVDEYISVLKTNTKNTIVYVNDNFCQISGYSKNELLGKNCRELRAQKHITKGDCDTISQKLINKKTISILFENVTKNQKKYFVDTKIYPLLDEKGEIREHLHLMYEVTDIIKIHEELESTQKDIIYRMGEIGESRSQETGNHVKRVAEYSKLLAHLAGLSKENANILFSASPMHDIGKVAIPDAILKKPGKLTPEEFEIMKSHSEIGFQVLQGSKRPILKAAAIVAYTHHEKYDGSGYPRGISGKEIHIFGRITAIADVFDALGSDRVYKKAWDLDKILNLFQEEKGKHFDPKLIELFFENLEQFLEIRDRFKDN
ncbi:response regulator [Sulfurimonas sp. NWX79]|uniref:response regulator n=1 Tax=Sulfurimonas sp. NWX79 TaxID=2925412 RepID=UPI003204D470